jgi:hypothetical protein
MANQSNAFNNMCTSHLDTQRADRFQLNVTKDLEALEVRINMS